VIFEKVLIVCSPTSEKDKTQASLVYLATVLNEAEIEYDVLDLGGSINYFDPPEEFFSPCDSEYWLSPRIFDDAHWFDRYFPSDYKGYDAVVYSALFSPDLLIYGRHAVVQKEHHPECITVIGGSAVNCLNEEQLSVLSEAFDHICIGHDIEYLVHQVLGVRHSTRSSRPRKYIEAKNPPAVQPNYELWEIRPFITVYSGQGCNWGKCLFCNTNTLSVGGYCPRPPEDIAEEFIEISKANGKVKDVMLSSDSFTKRDLVELMSHLKQTASRVPYNLMLRGEGWISEEIGAELKETGCTDVFIGAEALDDEVLRIINKGVTTEGIINAVKSLSEHVKVIIGLLLFIPRVTEAQLEAQLSNLEKILPFVESVEPEILSVVQNADLAARHRDYGIKLWATEKTINDSWCYGLSPDIPWTFEDEKEVEIWFRYYDEMRALLSGHVEPRYWDSIDHMRLRF
jgi:hypothetical protein